MGRNDHEAGGSSAGGRRFGRAAPRPLSLTPDEATFFTEARLLVPPSFHLPAGWKVSAAGYAIPPVPVEDEDLRGYIRRRRAELPPWDLANPDWAEDSALWRPRFELERVNELANDYGMYGGGRFNMLGRRSFWDGKDVDTELAALGYVPAPRGTALRLPPPYGEPREVPATPPRRQPPPQATPPRRQPPPQATPTRRHAGLVLRPTEERVTSEPRGQISIRRTAPHLRVPKPEPEAEAEPVPQWTTYLNYQSQIRAADDPADTPGLTQALQESKAEEDDEKLWSSDDGDDVILKDVELSYQAQLRAPDDPADTPGLTKALVESKAEVEDEEWWPSEDED